MKKMIEYCGECIHCVCDIPTHSWECDAGIEPEWDEEYEVWECDKYKNKEEVELKALARHEDMLFEQGKNKAKGVSDDIY
jgi:hypothetical protein